MIPETCIKDPLHVLGNDYTEISNIFIISAPVNDNTTNASLIIFEISEYLMGPWCIIQSFLIVPELQNETSVFKYNLIKSAKKFP